MTSERSQAYGVALQSFRTLEPAKFAGKPMALLIETMDTLLFASTVEEARDQLKSANTMLDGMVENDRLMPDTIERLKSELAAIGPAEQPAEQPVAA